MDECLARGRSGGAGVIGFRYGDGDDLAERARGAGGTETMTATATAAHGLTTVTAAFCTLGTDPGTGAGDPVACSVVVTANVATIKSWQDDWSAVTASHTVHWAVVGVP